MQYTYESLRTTGYTCTAVAQAILKGKFKEKGIIPPELLGMHSEVYNLVIDYLRKRNVTFK